MKGVGGFADGAYLRALDAWSKGPHPLLARVVCGSCNGKPGRIVATDDGVLLVGEYEESTPGAEGVEVSLLDLEAWPFVWRCNRHGNEAVPRDHIRRALAAPPPRRKVVIHRGHNARG